MSAVFGLIAGSLVLSGCSGASTGYLPTGKDGALVTTETGNIINLWVGTWVAALVVGVLVWGLTLWAIVAFRKRKSDTSLPVQLRYNVPIEILYTIVPVFMVGVLFLYTARYEEEIMNVTKNKPDLVINVVAKQWSWDFNYVESDVYDTGQHVDISGVDGNVARSQMPVLYLPVNKRVEFVLTARDVIHSFWVPMFLQKLDMVPGKVNRFQITPTQLGTFDGKCAELCGAYHSQMLFLVKVVTQEEYDRHMADLKAKGQTGLLDNTLNREQLLDMDKKLIQEATGGAAQ